MFFMKSESHSILRVRPGLKFSVYPPGLNSAPRIAVLAVQNMSAAGNFAKNQEIEFSALEGSLSMMSKGRSCAADA